MLKRGRDKNQIACQNLLAEMEKNDIVLRIRIENYLGPSCGSYREGKRDKGDMPCV
jgi:hypothetical protein